MSRIAVRAYTQKPNQKRDGKIYPFKEPPLSHERVLVFDTETTTDQYQNLTFGSFCIYHHGFLQHEGIFYNQKIVDENEIEILESYAKSSKIPLYRLDEFIDEVFYPEIFQLKTLCIGFNLAFDISRLAFRAVNARRKNRGGFTFTLSKNPVNPPITIKRIGNVPTFRLSSTIANTGTTFFSGHFLDVQTIAEVLLQEKRVSLERAAEVLNLSVRKQKTEKHGEISPSYIEYNRQDVKVTYEVYKKLVEELARFQIGIPITRIYSEASIGKHALKQLGIESFLSGQKNCLGNLLGNIMTVYYGGRTECRIRKTPTKVTVLDFTSMYPTITMLMGLWEFITAEGIETIDATDETRRLLETVDLAALQNRNLWKDFVVLVRIEPDNDVLPVRMDYKGNGKTFNVGINHLTADFPMWYALPDVIASKILTGKNPKIIEAIRFVPTGIKERLRTSDILGITIDPKRDNLIQVLVVDRQKIKQRMNGLPPDHPERGQLASREQAMKILVNAMSYGIFIELNPEDKKSEIEVYGLERFTTKKNHYEKPGTFFHPLLGVMITSGARLFLAMAEAKLLELGAHHAYMDTDSIFVPPEHANSLIEYFAPLSPYNVDIPLLKAEKEDVWFYGISSKRYALYRLENGSITFLDGDRSFKLHGLGHLTNPFPNKKTDWQEEIWRDILMLHYGMMSPLDVEMKYSLFFAIAKMTVNTAHLMSRFKVLNEGKGWREQIKPYNFFLIGFQMIKMKRKAVKPLSPYSKDSQAIVHEPFIDYESGETMQGSRYFKPLSKTILQYCEHQEYKYDGDIGPLTRKHIHADGGIHIGKEANNIEEQTLDGGIVQVFRNKEREREKIIRMRQCDAEKLGIDRKTRWRIIKNITLSKD